MKRLAFSCIAFCILAGNSIAGEFTAQLTCPNKVLYDEYHAEFKVALSNGTDSAIRIFERAGGAFNRQVFFGLGNPEHMDYCLREGILREKNPNVWNALSANTTRHDTRMLAPGQTHEWNFAVMFNPLVTGFIPDYLNIAQMGIYAQVLVGSSQWVYSNTNAVSVSAQGCDDGPILFTNTFTTPIGKMTTHVREITIDGERFLFYGCERICKLTGLGTPTITADPIHSNILTISLGTLAPPILYDTKKGIIP